MPLRHENQAPSMLHPLAVALAPTRTHCPRRWRLAALAASIIIPGTAPLTAIADTRVQALEEVVVTARRKDESLQDVPLTVNVVTGDTLEQLNIRNFADLQNVVAGLTLQEDSLAPNASVRGVRFDTYASGFNL